MLEEDRGVMQCACIQSKHALNCIYVLYLQLFLCQRMRMEDILPGVKHGHNFLLAELDDHKYISMHICRGSALLLLHKDYQLIG